MLGAADDDGAGDLTAAGLFVVGADDGAAKVEKIERDACGEARDRDRAEAGPEGAVRKLFGDEGQSVLQRD